MPRTCPACKGRGNFGKLGQYPCRVCGGSGYDPNWEEKKCLNCGDWFEYNVRWNNIPDYCESCRQPQYKSCANPDCSGQVEYRFYWDNIPKYCKICKGWRKRPCKNPDCNGKVDFHNDSTNIHDYCYECKGWRKKSCKRCGGEVVYHNDWDYPPNICDKCKIIVRQGRSQRENEESNMKRLREEFPQLREENHANKFHRYLERHYIRNIDKPASYEELRNAYLDFLSRDS